MPIEATPEVAGYVVDFSKAARPDQAASNPNDTTSSSTGPGPRLRDGQ